MSAVNPLVAFYIMNEKERCQSFLLSQHHSTRLTPLLKRGLKFDWFKTDAVTITLLANKSDSISYKPRLTLDYDL
jgi:hypothetical protein